MIIDIFFSLASDYFERINYHFHINAFSTNNFVHPFCATKLTAFISLYRDSAPENLHLIQVREYATFNVWREVPANMEVVIILEKGPEDSILGILQNWIEWLGSHYRENGRVIVQSAI